MVRRSVRGGALLTALAAVAFTSAAPAFADIGSPPVTSDSGQQHDPSPDPGQQNTSDPYPGRQDSASSVGSSGDPVQATVRSCSLYATSSSFGLSCVTPGGSGHAKPVREILDGDPGSFCWDARISDADLASKYEYQPNPDAPYYLESCITGLNPTTSLFHQPDVQVSQQVVELPAGAKPCAHAKHAKHGTKNKKKPAPAPLSCVKTLTKRQQTIVAGTAGKDAQIPGITMTTQPSTRVRTNEAVAYVDAATDANGDRITRTPDYTVGGVTLWAVMGSFTIQPFGPGQGPSIPCAGTAQVSSTDTPESMPDACWWTYDKSSAGQDGLVYPFRAEADWTVFYRDGGGTHRLASFRKYDDLKLPVNDIQTRVIN